MPRPVPELLAPAGSLDARGLLAAAAERRIKLLWVFHHDLFRSAWADGDIREALGGAETLVFQGTNANAVSAQAHLVLPSAAHAEREGTFTNFQGRVQRFRTAIEPPGEAQPDWRILAALGRSLGARDPAFAAERAEQVFAALTATAPAFSGMSYHGLGDTGARVRS